VADYQGARQSLAALTTKSWFLATEAYRQRALTEENVRLNRRMLELTEARYRVGKAVKQDGNLAKADLAPAEERLRKTQIAFEHAARGLEILLGRYSNADVEIRRDFTPN